MLICLVGLWVGVCTGVVPVSVATLLKSIWDWTVCFSRGALVVPIVMVSSWHFSSRLMRSSSSSSLIMLAGEAESRVRRESWFPGLVGDPGLFPWGVDVVGRSGSSIICAGVDLSSEGEVPCRENGGIVAVGLAIVVRFGLCFLGFVSCQPLSTGDSGSNGWAEPPVPMMEIMTNLLLCRSWWPQYASTSGLLSGWR